MSTVFPKDTEQDRTPTAPPTAQRPRWYLLYFVLAALDVVTVLASLTINQQMMQIYLDAVAVNREWSVRHGKYIELGQLANAVNAPGNDVFDSQDVQAETLRMRAALQKFDEEFAEARADVRANVSAEHAPQLFADFAALRLAMREMVDEANKIFDYASRRESMLAGQRMATMDRKFAAVNRALSRLTRNAWAIQSLYFDRQIEAAKVIKQLQYLIVALVILMILGALYYGSRLYRAVLLVDAERAANMDALTQARAAADAASEAKSRFLANMSHEIRTPLNTVFLTLDMLKDSALGDEQQHYLAMAKSSSQSLRRLIDDLLDLSKIEAGKLDLAMVPFSLAPFVQQLCAPFASRAAAKGVRFAAKLSPDLPQVAVGDPLRIGQIVGNLLDNAIKFTHAGSVELEVRRRQTLPPEAGVHEARRIALHFSVRDTGIGLTPEQQTLVFEDFVQADASTTRRYGGTGLGLSIARRLAALMGGQLGLESHARSGSTFWFDIALPAGDLTPLGKSMPGPVAETAASLVGQRILVVEDAADSRAIMAAMLRELGATVDEAEDGLQAVSAAEGRRFDLILMDVAMPGIDGFEATRRIRTSEVGRQEVPIIGLTAHAMDGVLEKCLDAGMDDHLAKPATRDQIVAVLRRWLPAAAAAN